MILVDIGKTHVGSSVGSSGGTYSKTSMQISVKYSM